MTPARELADRLEDLHEQATKERSHFYVGSLAQEAAQMLRTLADQQEWRPIETAPKDGTRILCVLLPYQPTIARWDRKWLTLDADDFFDQEGLWEEYLVNTEYHPTHWMPLPAPPARAQEPKT